MGGETLAFVIIAIVALIIIIPLAQVIDDDRKWAKVREAIPTMSFDQLIAVNEELEDEWREWDSKGGNIGSRDKALKKRRAAEYRIKNLRSAIRDRFPHAITSRAWAKQKAHLVANREQTQRMVELEKKLDYNKKMLNDLGIAGGQLLEKTQSSILNGVAASKAAGPVAGGIAYSVTEARNQKVMSENISKRAENDVWSEITGDSVRIIRQLDDIYEEIIKDSNPSALVHIYDLELSDK